MENNKSFSDYRYWQYIPHIIRIMQNNSTSIVLKGSEIVELVVKDLNISEEEIDSKKFSKGESAILDRIKWGLSYAKLLGYLQQPKRAYYSLTTQGLLCEKETLNNENFWYEATKNRLANSRITQNINTEDCVDSVDNSLEVSDPDSINHSIYAEPSWEVELTNYIKEMNPTMFEKFCLEVAKSLGVEDTNHSGGTNDKGIDGEGILIVDSFLQYKVGFQFKHYANGGKKVSSNEIREFSGSLGLGNYNIGVFITSSYFSKEAIKDAEQYTKIRLVNIKDLIELCTKSNEFLRPIESYEVVLENIRKFIDAK